MRGRAVTMITFKELFSELTKTHFRPKIFLPEDMNNAVVHHTRESVLLSKIDISINIPWICNKNASAYSCWYVRHFRSPIFLEWVVGTWHMLTPPALKQFSQKVCVYQTQIPKQIQKVKGKAFEGSAPEIVFPRSFAFPRKFPEI